MKKFNLSCIVLAAGVAGFATAHAAPPDQPGETRFQIGLTATSGLGDLKSMIEAANPGISVSNVVPVGLSLAGYHDFGNDWAVGGSLGPIIVGSGDASFHIVPVGVDARYFASRSQTMRTYLRAGLEKAFAGGDFVASKSAGVLLGVGFDFSAPQRSGWGLELAVHSASVLVRGNGYVADQTARPYKGTLTIGYTF